MEPLQAQGDIDAQPQTGNEVLELLRDHRIEAVLQHQELAVTQSLLDGRDRLYDRRPSLARPQIAPKGDNDTLCFSDHPHIRAGRERAVAQDLAEQATLCAARKGILPRFMRSAAPGSGSWS